MQWSWNATQVIQTGYKADSPAVEQGAQRSCAIAVLGDFQGSTGKSPEQAGHNSVLPMPWARGLETSQGPIQPELYNPI